MLSFSRTRYSRAVIARPTAIIWPGSRTHALFGITTAYRQNWITSENRQHLPGFHLDCTGESWFMKRNEPRTPFQGWYMGLFSSLSSHSSLALARELQWAYYQFFFMALEVDVDIQKAAPQIEGCRQLRSMGREEAIEHQRRNILGNPRWGERPYPTAPDPYPTSFDNTPQVIEIENLVRHLPGIAKPTSTQQRALLLFVFTLATEEFVWSCYPPRLQSSPHQPAWWMGPFWRKPLFSQYRVLGAENMIIWSRSFLNQSPMFYPLSAAFFDMCSYGSAQVGSFHGRLSTATMELYSVKPMFQGNSSVWSTSKRKRRNQDIEQLFDWETSQVISSGQVFTHRIPNELGSVALLSFEMLELQ